MIDSGALTDYTSNKDDIESELEKTAVKSSVDEELAKLKAERAKIAKKSEKQQQEEDEVKEVQEPEQQAQA
jgi:hypothetical protein